MALRCFDASARLTSFTKAAEEVHLTQGAVSHQILGLEAQLGIALFVRSRTGLVLTGAGKAYWLEISPALRQIERATQSVLTYKGNGGTLNLCVASSLATYWLMPRLGKFVAAHPEITINLATRIGPVDFATSAYDAAIEFCDGPADGLHAEHVLPLELRPYASPAWLRACGLSRSRFSDAELKNLMNMGALIRHTTVPDAWVAWLAKSGLADVVNPKHLRNGPQYDLLSMALNGAIAGLGIALLPDYLAQGAVAEKRLMCLSLKTLVCGKAYYLRYPEWKVDLTALSRFQTWLKTA